MRRHSLRNILMVFLIASLLAACQPRPTGPSSTPGTTPSASQAAETTVPPTLSPTATLEPARALLVSPDSGAVSAQAIQAALQELAASSELQLDVLTQLTAADLTPATRLVAVLAPDPGLAALAAAAPEVQFLAIDLPDVNPAENISVLTSKDLSSQTAFLAGYIAALVSPDWRAGVVTSTSAEDAAARDSFLAGGHYLCGLCNVPIKPYFYPVVEEVNPGDVQAAVDALTRDRVQTVFIAPSLATPEMLSGLSAAGFNLIGSSTPAADLNAHWVATVSSDPASALKTLWPDLIAGKGSQQAYISLSLTDLSADLTPGKQRLVDQLIQDLAAGWVDPKPGETGG